ncbi:MAG: AAA family ATPase, partial [Thermodesulfobacteriota bacterium]
MKIFSVEIKNFRQYRGDKKIEFSTDKEKSFTIIQGANGAGKTNLMNAITWCLYGKEEHLSEISQEKIVDPMNKKELEETPVDRLIEMRVRIKLGDDKPQYIIERVRKGYKLADTQVSYAEKDDFQVLWLSNDRDWKKVTSQPTYFVNLLLPQGIHDFFFFDGERLDNFFKADSNKRVQDAILKVSGIELLDTAMGHLDHVRDEIRRNAKGLSSDADRISGMIDSLKKDLDMKKAELASLVNQESEIANKIKDIDTELRETPSEKIKGLQEERERLSAEIDRRQMRLNDVKEGSTSHLIETAPYIYAHEAILSMSKLIDEKYKKGDLPPKIREPFLKELLESGECICGTDISQEGPQRAKVERLLRIALFSKVDQQIAEGKFTMSNMLSGMKQFIITRDKFGKEIKEIDDEILKKQERIKEVSTLIGETNVEEVARLESNRKALDLTRTDLLEKIGGLKNDIGNREEWLKGQQSEYSKELKKSKKYSYLMGQIELSEKALETLKTIKQELVDDVRRTIEVKTKQYFLSLIWKKEAFVDIKIDKHYNISVIHKGGWDALT